MAFSDEFPAHPLGEFCGSNRQFQKASSPNVFHIESQDSVNNEQNQNKNQKTTMTIYAKVVLVRHPLWLHEYGFADLPRRKKLLKKHGTTITSAVELSVSPEFEDASDSIQHSIIEGEIRHLAQFQSIPCGFRLFFEKMSEDEFYRFVAERQKYVF